MSTTVLSLSDVSVRRGDRVILGPINFQITHGERWVVLGPNGAGKSTLLQILATNMFPTQGVVRVLDKQMGSVDLFELRTRIGICGSVIAEDIPFDEIDVVILLTKSATNELIESVKKKGISTIYTFNDLILKWKKLY